MRRGTKKDYSQILLIICEAARLPENLDRIECYREEQPRRSVIETKTSQPAFPGQVPPLQVIQVHNMVD